MQAYLITDASYLERTNAGGIAGSIAVGNMQKDFRASTASIENPTQGEILAALYGVKKIRKMQEDEGLEVTQIDIATDNQDLINYMTEGFSKNRHYDPKTVRLVKDLNRQLSLLGVTYNFHKVKAHVEKNPSALEAMHNKVDKSARYAMVSLMNEIEHSHKKANAYTAILPQTLLDGEFDALEEAAYKMASEGLSPRVIAKLPVGDNPFEAGVQRYKAENPNSNVKCDVFPAAGSRVSKKQQGHHKGVTGLDKIQVIDALSRMGYADKKLAEGEEGLSLADVIRGFTGYQPKLEDAYEASPIKQEGPSQFYFEHPSAKRMSNYDFLSKHYSTIYDVPTRTLSDVIRDNKISPSKDIESELTV